MKNRQAMPKPLSWGRSRSGRQSDYALTAALVVGTLTISTGHQKKKPLSGKIQQRLRSVAPFAADWLTVNLPLLCV